MKDRSFQVSKDLDSTEELVQVVGQAGLRVVILGIRKEIDLRFFSLRLGGESGVDIEEAVSNKPRNERDDS